MTPEQEISELKTHIIHLNAKITEIQTILIDHTRLHGIFSKHFDDIARQFEMMSDDEDTAMDSEGSPIEKLELPHTQPAPKNLVFVKEDFDTEEDRSYR